MKQIRTATWLAGLGLPLVACSSVGPSAGANGTPTGAPSSESPAGGGNGTTVDENGPGPGLPLAGGAPPPTSTGDCSAPPPPSELIGWASDGTGTVGGGDAAPVIVTEPGDFDAAVDGDEPRVVQLQGSIEGRFEIGSNKTVVGVCGAQITGHIRFNGSSNSILRNLKVVGRNCTDSPADCSGGDDAITLSDGAHHIWVDHLDVSDGSDGNLDITQGSDFVTVSWTKFSYSSRRVDPLAGATGHRFSNLIGSSDTDPRDPGHLNVTFHHDWWADNVDQRMPRTRRGQIHVFNSLYSAAGNSYCTDAGFEAKLLVQNNIYVGVNRPLEVRDGGNMRSEGNVFQNTMGTQTTVGTGFTPPYAFTLNATAGLDAALRASVGPH
jgi:pectate lyase